MAVAATPVASSASSSHDHPTWPSSGSAPNSGSSTARTKVTTRKVPSQASGAAGSCSTTKRPVAASSSSTTTSAERARANGAMRCGAGTSSSTTSGRSLTARNPRTAAWKSSGASSGILRTATCGSVRRQALTRCHDALRSGMKGSIPVTRHPGLETSDFLRACRRLPVERTPVWFMRQAGRSLPEYRKVREGIGMLESCRRPDLVAEITLQPVRRYGVDAAIFYSDIVVPLAAAGVDLDIVPGVGPVIAEPIRTRADLDRLRPLAPEDVPYVAEAVRLLVAELGPTPLIGFAGAPFTLASYLVEGGPSRDLLRTKALMLGDPALWHNLLDRLAQITRTFLEVQVAAGASAVQLFDSWVGALSARDYAESVRPAAAALLEPLSPLRVPPLHLGVGARELLALMAGAGADVVGVDFRLPLDGAARRVGPGRALQGNLDPAALFAPRTVLRERVERALAEGRAAHGHVFNLGHGVPPDADPDQLAYVVELVHRMAP